MKNASRHTTRFLKSVSKLGLLNGGVILYYYILHRLFPHKRWQLREVALRGVSKPIWMRPGVSDWIVMERIFLDREYDPISPPHDVAMDRLEADIIASGKTPLIIDCGANIGLSAIWFAQRFPRARVVALEPEPGNFAVLSKNAQNFPNITPLWAAISDRDTSVSLSNMGDTPWAWRVEEGEGEGEGEGIPCLTITNLLLTHADCQIFVVKVDIEGFETKLMRSGTEWVDDLPLMIFEPHDWMMPWSATGDVFFRSLSRRLRDYLLLGENVFAYSHELVRPADRL